MGEKWNGKSVYKLKQKKQEVASLDAALGAVRRARNDAHEAFLAELGRVIERDPASLQVGTWDCDGSPVDRCVYDLTSEERDEECLFCYMPNERK